MVTGNVAMQISDPLNKAFPAFLRNEESISTSTRDTFEKWAWVHTFCGNFFFSLLVDLFS